MNMKLFSKKTILLCISGLLSTVAQAREINNIQQTTAITQVFGDGQKFTAVAVQYPQAIKGSSLDVSDFSVTGRTIVNTYTSDAAVIGQARTNGRYVVLELSPDETGAMLRTMVKPNNALEGMAQEDASKTSDEGSKEQNGPPATMPEVIKTPAQANITQTGELTTTKGNIYSTHANAVSTSTVRNMIVDDFQQLTFKDPTTGDTLKYNLYRPKGYDKNKAYPLILFMHDAGATSHDTKNTLEQGLGAVAFASARDQQKHPAFVLAPQFERQVVNDQSEATSDLDTTVHLIQQLTREYNIDTNRLYTTGQSGGAMMSIAMNIKYPGLFAASLIVAGQWDVSKVAPLVNDKLWIIVSEGDLKAYPGENAITAALEQHGAKVERAVWDGTKSSQELTQAAQQLMARGAAINYVALKKGTVVPAGQDDNGGNNHINTWRIAYAIDGLRDWLLAQRK